MSCTNYDPLKYVSRELTFLLFSSEELDGLDRHSKEFVDHLLENHLEEKDLDVGIYYLNI